MVNIVSIKEYLLKVRNLIKEYGWTKGRDRDENGRFCVLGAFCHVRDNLEESRISIYLIDSRARIRFKEYNNIRFDTNIWQWNDSPKRTKEDIIKAFNRAIYCKRIKKVNS